MQVRLKELRKERGLRQKDVAQLLNITQMSYSYYERGLREPEIALLIKLAELFNVSVDYLIENENVRLEKLTTEERRVFNKFRMLNGYNKTRIEERIDVFLEQQKMMK